MPTLRAAPTAQGWTRRAAELGKAFRHVFRSLSRLRGRDTHLAARSSATPSSSCSSSSRSAASSPRASSRAPRSSRRRRSPRCSITSPPAGTWSARDSEQRPARGRLQADPARAARDPGQARRRGRPAGSRRLVDVDVEELRAATHVLTAPRRSSRTASDATAIATPALRSGRRECKRSAIVGRSIAAAWCASSAGRAARRQHGDLGHIATRTGPSTTSSARGPEGPIFLP